MTAAYLGTGFEDSGISAVYLPHTDPANATVPAWTYLLCLRPPYKQAEHYLGSASGLAERLRQHGTCGGARLLQVQREAGGDFLLTRTWPGGRDVEHHFKAQRQSPKLCPHCTPDTAARFPPRPGGAVRGAQAGGGASPAAPGPAAGGRGGSWPSVRTGLPTRSSRPPRTSRPRITKVGGPLRGTRSRTLSPASSLPPLPPFAAPNWRGVRDGRGTQRRWPGCLPGT